MRLHLALTPNRTPVPFAYPHRLIGAFHKWLGINELHDRLSLYSLSWLDGSRAVNGHLEFPHEARWFLSAHDDERLERLVDGILASPAVCCGMRVHKVEQQPTPDFGPRYVFKVGSPVLARGPDENGKDRHYTYDDPASDAILTATLRHKMDVAGLDAAHKNVTVAFDRNYRQAKTKLVTFKDGIQMRANICPVIIEGTPEALRFAWNVGVGHGTGSGFGSLR